MSSDGAIIDWDLYQRMLINAGGIIEDPTATDLRAEVKTAPEPEQGPATPPLTPAA